MDGKYASRLSWCYYAPTSIKWWAVSVCPSVCLSRAMRMERFRKLKIGRMKARHRVNREPIQRSKGQRSRSQGQHCCSNICCYSLYEGGYWNSHTQLPCCFCCTLIKSITIFLKLACRVIDELVLKYAHSQLVSLASLSQSITFSVW